MIRVLHVLVLGILDLNHVGAQTTTRSLPLDASGCVFQRGIIRIIHAVKDLIDIDRSLEHDFECRKECNRVLKLQYYTTRRTISIVTSHAYTSKEVSLFVDLIFLISWTLADPSLLVWMHRVPCFNVA